MAKLSCSTTLIPYSILYVISLNLGSYTLPIFCLYRDGLVLEVEALQQSSSKLNEERIFELKQRLEDILMDNDTMSEEGQRLKREVKSLRYVEELCITTPS